MKRRSFLTAAGSIIGGSGLGLESLATPNKLFPKSLITSEGEVPRRPLGKTGEHLSIVGFPGNGLQNYTQKVCNSTLHNAMELGLNYIDVAPAYGIDGECEVRVGKALKGGKRDKVIISCKTKKRDAVGARQELETSLKHLKTDHIDIYQMHVMQTLKEVEDVFAPGGAMETFVKAREEGKVRFLGFSAHTTIAALELMNRFQFNTVMYPINFVEHFAFGFGQAIVEKAENQGVSVIAIKPTSGGGWPKDTPKEQQSWWFQMIMEQEIVDMAWRFTLSQKNVMTAMPAASLENFDLALNAARKYKPITKDEMEKLHELAKTRESIFLKRQERAYLGYNQLKEHSKGDDMC